MALVTYLTYARITGDQTTAPSDVTAALSDAQSAIEAALRRPLEATSRTERMKLVNYSNYSGGLFWGYRAYPLATPILSVEDGYDVAGDAITNVNPAPPLLDWDWRLPLYVDITYTGGYSADTLPMPLVRAIARQAWVDIHAPTSLGSVPLGANLVVSGDARVGWKNGAGMGLTGLATEVWDSVKAYARRPV